MDVLSLSQLESLQDGLNALLDPSAQDLFCSSSFWTLPAHQAFGGERPLWLRRSENGFVSMAISRMQGKRVLFPLDQTWTLGSPVAARNGAELAREFAAELEAETRPFPIVSVTGLAASSSLWLHFARALQTHHTLYLGEPVGRFRASLAGGMDGWLSRRARKFRANLRRMEARARDAGLSVERVPVAETAEAALRDYQRIVDIETRSWKGLTGTGLSEPSMRRFYEVMLPMLAPRKAIRLNIARRGEQDVGYLLGAVLRGTFRGLQVSFDATEDTLSVGNYLQWQMIQQLCGEQCEWYDLGQAMEYKRLWGEQLFETTVLIAYR